MELDAFKLLAHNKYFLMICGAYLMVQIYSATLGMGIYFIKYVLWLLMIFNFLITIILIKLNVEKANERLKVSINK